MSLVQIKMHLGIIKKGLFFFFSSFPAAVPQHKPFVSGQEFKNVNPVCAPVGYTAPPVGSTITGDLCSEGGCLVEWTSQIAGTITQSFAPERIDGKAQCNKLKVLHIRTKRYNPGNLRRKPCGVPQNSKSGWS